MTIKINAASHTTMVYIGTKRYNKLALFAREVSIIANTNIKPSQIAQYLIDECGVTAKNRLIKKLAKEKKYLNDANKALMQIMKDTEL